MSSVHIVSTGKRNNNFKSLKSAPLQMLLKVILAVHYTLIQYGTIQYATVEEILETCRG